MYASIALHGGMDPEWYTARAALTPKWHDGSGEKSRRHRYRYVHAVGDAKWSGVEMESELGRRKRKHDRVRSEGSEEAK